MNMTGPVTRAVAEMNLAVAELNLIYGPTLAALFYPAVAGRPQKNLAVGDWVYVMTNPHRGRKGQLIQKRGYTQWYIRLVPKHRR
ncbi:MAG: hypothetical protein ACRCZI_13725, partial [Cetobacterium sp.]